MNVVERFKKESMCGMSSEKTGRCRVRQVAVVKKWPLVDVRKIYYISRKQLILDDKNEKCRKHLLQKLKHLHCFELAC